MADINVISELKNCILVFEYPLANSMDDDQIAEIFNRSNRCFLVSWIINLLNKACDDVLQDMETTEEYLANLIHSMGFCLKNESMPFMKGTLGSVTELEIIRKMFLALKRARQTVPEVHIALEDIEVLKNIDLNLFPNYGDIKVSSHQENKQSENRVHTTSSHIAEEVLPMENVPQQIEIVLSKLEEEYPNITNKIREFEKDRNTRSKEPINVDENSQEVLMKCAEKLTMIYQYLQDIKTIEEFNNSNTTDSPCTVGSNDEWREMLKDINNQFVDVYKCYRRNK